MTILSLQDILRKVEGAEWDRADHSNDGTHFGDYYTKIGNFKVNICKGSQPLGQYNHLEVHYLYIEDVPFNPLIEFDGKKGGLFHRPDQTEKLLSNLYKRAETYILAKERKEAERKAQEECMRRQRLEEEVKRAFR